MNHEERIRMHESLHNGLKMVVEKLEKVSREKQSWSLCDLGMLSDIMKDVSKTEKNILEIHHMLAEHSDETF